MTLDHIAPGEATLSMTILDMSTAMASATAATYSPWPTSAFAFACNSYNQLAVAQHCSDHL